jgi:acetyl esterase/lipase
MLLALSGCVVPNPGPGETLPRYYSAPPAARVVQDVPYGKATKPLGTPLGDDGDAHRLDLYLPQGPSNKVILWMHGGGWVNGHNENLLQVIQKQVSRGFVVASVGYRNASCPAAEARSNTFPAPVLDVKMAVRWVKTRGAEYGFSAEHVILAGQSAGGHLALFAGTDSKYEPAAADLLPGLESETSNVSAMISFVGPADLVNLYERGARADATDFHRLARELAGNFANCTRTAHVRTSCDAPGFEQYACTEAQLREASPVYWLDAADPPAHLVYGKNDQLIDSGQQGGVFADKLSKAKGDENTAWLDWIEDGDHFVGEFGNEHTLHLTALEVFLDLAAAGPPL